MRKIILLALVALFSQVSIISAQNLKSIEFEHLFDSRFNPERIQNVRWMNDGRFYSATQGRQIIRFNITNGESNVIFDGSNFTDPAFPNGFNVQGYQFSADEKKILLRTDVEQIWRRSTRENYYVYDRSSNQLSKLTKSEGKQSLAELSPKGDKVAFVRENNLFWIDLASGVETQITNDGEFNKIINGSSDWVYEEEFGFSKAWQWSPNGERIAFYKFNEERVKEFFMTNWGTLYPTQERFKYPKAGEQNSIVSIFVYDLNSKRSTKMDVGDEDDQYIPRINWTINNNRLAIRRMTRLQNKQDLLFADVRTGDTEVILTEESERWIDVHDDLVFLNNGRQFITTSQKDGYNHIYLYDMSGEELTQITSGNWEVTSIQGFNEAAHTLYYTSTEESTLERHFYQVRVDGDRKKKLTEKAGWYSVNLSRDYKYYIETYTASNQPPITTLYQSNVRGNNRKLRTLVDNSGLVELKKEYNFSEKEFFTVEANGAELNGYMLKPNDFDSTKKYPLFMYVYGGPGSQTVSQNYESGDRAMWHQHLVNNGYIVVSVDNRGTGGRGRDFEQQTYLKLGQLEIADQISVAKHFGSKSFIDENRIGIWGWSYGGYMSSLGLTEGSDIFSAAIAVAPVTHWKYYDTIYTERFMRTPQLNPEGYNNGSPLFNVQKMKGKYLLVHGTGDDNVHYQNAVDMMDALIANNIQFETMTYPNRNHGIYGGNTRMHLYKLMTNFILENL